MILSPIRSIYEGIWGDFKLYIYIHVVYDNIGKKNIEILF